MTKDELQLYADFSVYINQDRLESILTKLDKTNWGYNVILRDLLIIDAVNSFETDRDAPLMQTTFWSKAVDSIDKLSEELVREHFKRDH